MTEGKIVSWVKSPGDSGKRKQWWLVESDKADMDVESFYEGLLPPSSFQLVKLLLLVRRLPW